MGLCVIDSVLIANRGEIAVRIARTLKRLGVTSYGVYAPVDSGAPHTRAVDRAVPLAGVEGAGALAPYLDIEAIIAAARSLGAEAVHPGYGFVAESAEAARACERAGLIWIGPSAEAIARLGDKAEAKRLAAEAGVPVVPGLSEQPGESGVPITAEAVAAFAAEHGFPVMIKAGAGGGGKGMRRVAAEDEIAPALDAARREAIAAFGAGHLLVERLIEPARHIEMQIAVDAEGRGVALGERECSLQRRHQKLIEESPSPAVTPALRERLGRAAVDLALAAGYRNLGTAEFLVDFDDPERFYFLELNARLQVEHPVTEAVTGLDLVELQLELADGKPIGERAAGVLERGLDGHAIEARICAERPADGFLPATGSIARYAEPVGARVDSGVERGSLVTADFDPMLAKVIVHAPNREQALARLRRALGETVTLGVETNSAFLAWLADRPEVRDGATAITTVERLVESGAYRQALDDARPAALTAAAAALAEAAGGDQTLDGSAGVGAAGFDLADAWRPHGTGWGWWDVEDDAGKTHRLAARPGAGALEVRVDGGDAVRVPPGAPTHWWVGDDRVEVQGDFGVAGFSFVRELSVEAAPPGSLEATLPGVVLAVEVAVGDTVEAGQTLLTLESMKMEIAVTAPEAGVVAELSVGPGDHVSRGQVLAEVEPQAAAGEASEDPVSEGGR